MKLRPTPYVWVSFAMIVGVMGTALISPLYGLYRDAWGLKPSDVSMIYVVYMFGALCGLLTLGRLADRLGFRPVMTGSLVLVLVGTLISLAAPDLAVLSVGRFIVGVASSMMTTSATVGLTALSPFGRPQRAAVMAGLLMAVGFGLGPLLGGIMGQWAPAPLVTTYVPTLVLGALGLWALRRVPLPAEGGGPSRRLHWRDLLPHLTWPEASASSTFLLTCILPFLVFGVFGLYAAMSPLFLDKLVPWHGPVVSGTAIALILFMSAAVQNLVSHMKTYRCGSRGMAVLVLSNALLMVNLFVGSGLLFVIGVVCTSIGHGMGSVAGMSVVTRIAGPHNRSGLVATFLLVGYIGSMLPMMAMGWIADHWGLPVAVCAFCSMVIVLGTVVGVLFHRHPRIRAVAG